MDAGRSAERAGQLRQGNLVSQVPQHTQHRLEEWARTRRPGPEPTPVGAAESGGRGLLDDAEGTGPCSQHLQRT